MGALGRRRVCTGPVVLLALLLAVSPLAAAAPLLVTNSNATGPGSLYAALSDANSIPVATEALVEVVVELGAAANRTVVVNPVLPSLTRPIRLEGHGLTIAAASTLGPGAAGLFLHASATGSRVSNLTVTGFGVGLDSLASGVVVRHVTAARNRVIGIRTQGAAAAIANTTAADNGQTGVVVTGPDTLVTGCSLLDNGAGVPEIEAEQISVYHGVLLDMPASRSLVEGSVISGNYIGVEVRAEDCTLRHNRVGTDAQGVRAHPNRRDGIVLGAESVERTPSVSEVRANVHHNLASGNARDGMQIKPGSNGNRIHNNLVGVDATGARALPNGDDGLQSRSGAARNTIGPNNVFSGNTESNLVLYGTDEVCTGNLIGTDATGEAAVAYPAGVTPTGLGVVVWFTARNLLLNASVISGHSQAGVAFINGASGHRIEACLIGTSRSGSHRISNRGGVVVLSTAHSIVIANSVLSGNVIGLQVQPSVRSVDLLVTGCTVGLDPGQAFAIPNSENGIEVQAGAAGVTLRDTVVAGNPRLSIKSGGDALLLEGCSVGTDALNRFVTSANGLSEFGGSGVVVRDSVFAFSPRGPYIFASDVRFERVVSHNHTGEGMSIDPVASNLVVSNSSFLDNGGSGVVVAGAATRFTGCRLLRNAFAGLDLASQSADAAVGPGNAIAHNGGFGVQSDGRNCTVTANAIHDNGLSGISIRVTALNDVITHNRIFANQQDGVVIRQPGTVLQSNEIFDNARAGVAVADTAAGSVVGERLGRTADGGGNHIFRNGGAGVDAQAPATVLANAFDGNGGAAIATLSGDAPSLLRADRREVLGSFVPTVLGNHTVELYAFEACALDPSMWGAGRPVARWVVPIAAVSGVAGAGLPSAAVPAPFLVPLAGLGSGPSGNGTRALASLAATVTSPSGTTSAMSPCISARESTEACSICSCAGTAVNCRGVGLTFVPTALPANTTDLDLATNSIGQLLPGDLQDALGAPLARLERLDLAGNRLVHDPTAALTAQRATLRELVLDSNPFTLALFSCEQFPSLELLSANDGPSLAAVDPRMFSCASLQRLFLSGTGLGSRFFTGLVARRRNTPLQAAPALRAPYLEELSIERNELTALRAGWLAGLPALRRLDLAGNNVQTVDADAFAGLDLIEVIDLSRQRTGPMPPGDQFSGLGKLQALRWDSGACPAGMGLGFQDTGLDIFVCLPCGEGTFKPAGPGGIFECVPCAAGTADLDLNSGTPCTDCPVGTYAAEGTTRCAPCAATAVDADADPSTPCLPCLPGSFRSSSALCTPCPPGHTDPDSDPTTPCELCAGSIVDGSCQLAASGGGDDAAFSTALTIVVVLLVLLVLVVAVFALLFWRRRHEERKPHDFEQEIEDLHATGLIADGFQLPKELPRKSVTLLDDCLGSGFFGEVHKAQYDGFIVAVKTVKQSATANEMKALLQEAVVMAQLNHENIVGLVGVCTTRIPVYIVMRYCEEGNLHGFLKSREDNDGLDFKSKITVALDIARGMEYLTQHGIVHRDLAARNVLLDSAFVCKIADFGLARNLEDSNYYRINEQGNIPIRWSALEVIERSVYTAESDVWSYGITLYEVFTFAATPYVGMTNHVVWMRVKEGYRLPQPPLCPSDFYEEVMLPCWEAKPEERIDFPGIIKYIAQNYRTQGSNPNSVRRLRGWALPPQQDQPTELFPTSPDGYVALNQLDRERASLRLDTSLQHPTVPHVDNHPLSEGGAYGMQSAAAVRRHVRNMTSQRERSRPDGQDAPIYLHVDCEPGSSQSDIHPTYMGIPKAGAPAAESVPVPELPASYAEGGPRLWPEPASPLYQGVGSFGPASTRRRTPSIPTYIDLGGSPRRPGPTPSIPTYIDLGEVPAGGSAAAARDVAGATGSAGAAAGRARGTLDPAAVAPPYIELAGGPLSAAEPPAQAATPASAQPRSSVAYIDPRVFETARESAV